MPFITEEIWQALPHEGDYLMLAQWPVYKDELNFAAEESTMELVMDAIRAVRTRRAEMNVPPSKKAQLTIATAETEVFELGIPFLKRMAYASDVNIVTVDTPAQEGAVTVITHVAQISMPMAELVDMAQEKARMERELKKNQIELDKLTTKLGNAGFVAKAPEAIIAVERERAEKLTELCTKIADQLKTM